MSNKDSIYFYGATKNGTSDAWTLEHKFGPELSKIEENAINKYIHWDGLQNNLPTNQKEGLITLFKNKKLQKTTSLLRYLSIDHISNRRGINANIVSSVNGNITPYSNLKYLRNVTKRKNYTTFKNLDTKNIKKSLYTLYDQKNLLLNIIASLDAHKNTCIILPENYTVLNSTREFISLVFDSFPESNNFVEYVETFANRGHNHMIYVGYNQPKIINHEKKQSGNTYYSAEWLRNYAKNEFALNDSSKKKYNPFHINTLHFLINYLPNHLLTKLPHELKLECGYKDATSLLFGLLMAKKYKSTDLEFFNSIINYNNSEASEHSVDEFPLNIKEEYGPKVAKDILNSLAEIKIDALEQKLFHTVQNYRDSRLQKDIGDFDVELPIFLKQTLGEKRTIDFLNKIMNNPSKLEKNEFYDLTVDYISTNNNKFNPNLPLLLKKFNKKSLAKDLLKFATTKYHLHPQAYNLSNKLCTFLLPPSESKEKILESVLNLNATLGVNKTNKIFNSFIEISTNKELSSVYEELFVNPFVFPEITLQNINSENLPTWAYVQKKIIKHSLNAEKNEFVTKFPLSLLNAVETKTMTRKDMIEIFREVDITESCADAARFIKNLKTDGKFNNYNNISKLMIHTSINKTIKYSNLVLDNLFESNIYTNEYNSYQHIRKFVRHCSQSKDFMKNLPNYISQIYDEPLASKLIKSLYEQRHKLSVEHKFINSSSSVFELYCNKLENGANYALLNYHPLNPNSEEIKKYKEILAFNNKSKLFNLSVPLYFYEKNGYEKTRKDLELLLSVENKLRNVKRKPIIMKPIKLPKEKITLTK